MNFTPRPEGRGVLLTGGGVRAYYASEGAAALYFKREAEILDTNNTECTYKQGSLPGCSALGLAVTPAQASSKTGL